MKNDFKTNWLMRFGNFISTFGMCCQQYGFLYSLKLLFYNYMYMIIRYLYNNNSFCNKFIKKKVNKNTNFPILLSDIMFSYNKFDFKEYISLLSEQQKEEVKKNSKEFIDKIIKDYNINEQSTIDSLYNMLQF